MKRNLLCILALILSTPCVTARAALVYTSGHADLGVGFEEGNLHLHIHAEQTLGLYGGGTLDPGEYEPGDLLIGVPGPSFARGADNAIWGFLAPNAGDPFWALPQSSDPNKPFLGLGTEELVPENGWTSTAELTWTLNSIARISGDLSSFALWQNDINGNQVVFASTLEPTADNNSWTQGPESHDHFNFGFTGEGIYDVSFTISGTNEGMDFSDTASFRFVTGAAIAAVPEPGSLLALGLTAIGGVFVRRQRRPQAANTRVSR